MDAENLVYQRLAKAKDSKENIAIFLKSRRRVIGKVIDLSADEVEVFNDTQQSAFTFALKEIEYTQTNPTAGSAEKSHGPRHR
jgi:hypothetical protein